MMDEKAVMKRVAVMLSALNDALVEVTFEANTVRAILAKATPELIREAFDGN